MDRLQRILAHISPKAETPRNLLSSVAGLVDYPQEPLKVVVTGAAGQIGYALLPLLLSGRIFGPTTRVSLRLLEVESALPRAEGVAMELVDGSYPLLADILISADPRKAFAGADYVFLVGAFPRQKGMERADLLAKNAAIFKEQGTALGEVAAPNCRVLVVGNPANTNALIAADFAVVSSKGRMKRSQFSAMTRLDQHRLEANLAQKLQVPVFNIKNVVIWGNHSATQFPDVAHGTVTYPYGSVPIRSVLDAEAEAALIKLVQNRGAEVIAKRGASSAMSAAHAAAEHMRSWHQGTAPGEWVSMGVESHGEYGTEPGLFFSFPCTVENGEWKIVTGLRQSEAAVAHLKRNNDELKSEAASARASK